LKAEAKVRRMITVTPDPAERFTNASAESMVGDRTELFLGPRTVEGAVIEANLRADGNVELIVELDANPGSGHVKFIDGFELRVWHARSE
jgi:hypothetical protein